MRLLTTFIALTLPIFSLAQSASSYAVHLQIEVLESPDRLELQWTADQAATSYNIYRKAPSSQTFGAIYATVTGADTTYVDTDVTLGEAYEYSIRKYTNSYTGYGYAMAGVEVRMGTSKGDILLIVESDVQDNLSAEVADLVADLTFDGWVVSTEEVDRDTTVEFVKEMILDREDELDNLEMIYLLGHVPVPYSGNLAPDAHSNHVGAWPADAYYAELNGTWTDNSITNTTASDTRNHNVPNDGKFDQSTLPSPVELMISRVDFANLPVFTEDEMELTRRYLNRVHEYKNGEWSLEKRALIDDNFGGFNGEAFAANGWRNFAPLVGKDQIFAADYRTTLATDEYLFAYGCGGGSFTSANGIGTSAQLATDSLLTGFTMMFGSYFGDWDRPDNFLRSSLAQGRSMSVSWAGRPHWHYHSMGLGHPIGYGTKISQNNSTLYHASYGAQFVTIAQLGDPSLRIEYPAPATSVSVDTVDTFHVLVSWTASQDVSVEGYFVYQRILDSPWFRKNDEPVAGTSFIDSCVIFEGTYEYMVRATRLDEDYSGSYYNESLGSAASLTINTTKTAAGVGDFVQDPESDPVTGTFVGSYLSWVTDFKWEVDGNTLTGNNAVYETGSSNGELLNYTYELYNVCSTIGETRALTLSVEPVNEQSFVIFPNPAATESLIQIDVDGPIRAVHIYTMDGRRVKSYKNVGRSISLPQIPSGMYQIQCDLDNGSKYETLIVQ
jgi:hypothetical protein